MALVLRSPSGSLTSAHPAGEGTPALAAGGFSLLVGLLGCSAGAPPVTGQPCGTAPGVPRADAGATRPPPAAAPDAGASSGLRVAAFDCHKLDGNVAQATGGCSATPSAATAGGIRGWNGGGPEGSTWNAEALACDASIRLDCSGTLEIMLKVGSRQLARVSLQAADVALHCSFRLPPPAWRAELDQGGDLPFRTGILRVESYLVCTDPPAVLRADDHFVAGFAWGE